MNELDSIEALIFDIATRQKPAQILFDAYAAVAMFIPGAVLEVEKIGEAVAKTIKEFVATHAYMAPPGGYPVLSSSDFAWDYQKIRTNELNPDPEIE